MTDALPSLCDVGEFVVSQTRRPTMGKPYFVKAKTSGTWHIIYPGENRPLCGTRAALDDMSGTFNIPGSSSDNYHLCFNCKWARRLSEDKVHITIYGPKVVCSECGAKVTINRWPHLHKKIWQVSDDE